MKQNYLKNYSQLRDHETAIKIKDGILVLTSDR